MERKFKGIWIPASFWESKDLNILEKVLLADIDSLSSDTEGCFASNSYFANFFGISKGRISIIINDLVKKKYLRSEVVYKTNSKEIEKRFLWINKNTVPMYDFAHTPIHENKHTPIHESMDTPIHENMQDITKNIYNKELIKKEEVKKEATNEQAEILLNEIISLFPEKIANEVKTEKATKKKWIETIAYCNEKKGYSYKQLKEIIIKAREDDFWCKNFMSVLKLKARNKEGIMYIDYFNEIFLKQPQNTQKQVQSNQVQPIQARKIEVTPPKNVVKHDGIEKKEVKFAWSDDLFAKQAELEKRKNQQDGN